jgi:WD and tetratricopeptide repeat-containing protein 1
VPRSELRGGRILSLSDILYRSEANSDASQDGPRSEREDSDYDEEVELDFETSISGDEGHDVESNILHGSLNVRFHRRGDSPRESAGANGTCGSPSSSSQNDRISYQVHFHFLFIFYIHSIVSRFAFHKCYVLLNISPL